VAVNVVIPTSVEYCNNVVQDLPNVSKLGCCIIDGQLTSSKYFEELNVVINPVPKYYLDVCKGFCTDGYNSIDGTCINGVGEYDFANCIRASEPGGCYGVAQPVAISGINPY